MPTGQSDGGNSSAEVPASQLYTEASAQLTKPGPYSHLSPNFPVSSQKEHFEYELFPQNVLPTR